MFPTLQHLFLPSRSCSFPYAKAGLFVHPLLATVTYLCDAVKTYILNAACLFSCPELGSFLARIPTLLLLVMTTTKH